MFGDSLFLHIASKTGFLNTCIDQHVHWISESSSVRGSDDHPVSCSIILAPSLVVVFRSPGQRGSVRLAMPTKLFCFVHALSCEVYFFQEYKVNAKATRSHDQLVGAEVRGVFCNNNDNDDTQWTTTRPHRQRHRHISCESCRSSVPPEKGETLTLKFSTHL